MNFRLNLVDSMMLPMESLTPIELTYDKSTYMSIVVYTLIRIQDCGSIIVMGIEL